MMWTVSFAGAALAAAVGMMPAEASRAPAGQPLRPPTVADPARGLDLWRGAKVGMRLAQVRAIFPAATPPLHPDVLTGGEVDRLVLPDVEVAGRPATAHFFFKDGELVSVQLTLTELKPGASARNLQIVQRIAADFTARYGQGYDCGNNSLADVDTYECKWLKAPLSIRLWYMDTAGQAPLFYLAFRQVDDPGYNL